MTNPFLRWAGSKRQLLPILAKHWSGNYCRYVEPFAGSACLFFHLSPSAALLGDVNEDLVHTYRQVRDRVHLVGSTLKRMHKSKREYLRLRSLDPNSLAGHERAARFIYLNRFCFNGLYRTNNSGRFNVPYSGRKTGDLPTPEELAQCSKLLRGAELVVGDFSDALQKVQNGDFVYMDPPFSVRSRRVFNEYDRSTFGPDHLKRLRRWMEKLKERNISFLVSYAESEEADFLKTGFNTHRVSVRRNIAGFAGHRSRSNEILISYTASRKR